MLPAAMSRILEIAVNVLFLFVIVGFAGWVVWRSLKRSDDPAKALLKALVTIGIVVGDVLFIRWASGHSSGGESAADYGLAFVIAGSIGACGIILSIMWTPQISDLLISPLTSQFDGGKQEMEPKPYYSIAISKRKMNRPLEAIMVIREQLAKFPNDFEGVTLLANIQAEDMKDLPSAEITFNHFCDSPGAPPRQAAAAWTQMADWHLKIAQDADSARVALERIIAKFPDSPLSFAAAQRIAHLGGAEKILLEAHDRQPVFVPEGVKNIGLLDSTDFLKPAEDDPAQLASVYVKHLEQHPLDTEVREKLAVIYAGHYKRLDLATLELNQLIEEPNQPPKRVAHWMNLLANLQMKGGADCDTVRETLEKIVERFPGSPAAEIAQSRLARLKLEFKGKEETPGVKLGVYEQNIGLKYGSPRQL
jgi:tetratricopeptide (TPR) repeat protein